MGKYKDDNDFDKMDRTEGNITNWRLPNPRETEDIARYIRERSNRFDIDEAKVLVEDMISDSNIIVKDKFRSDIPGGFTGRIVIIVDPEEGPFGVEALKYERDELTEINNG